MRRKILKKIAIAVLPLLFIIIFINLQVPQVAALDNPHIWYGYVYDQNGSAVPAGTNVQLTHQDHPTDFITVQTIDLGGGVTNFYQVDVAGIENASDGDTIIVNSSYNGETGENSTAIDIAEPSQQVDVHLSNNPPYATGIGIAGDFTLDDLTGSYTYNDNESNPETGTSFNWYESPDGSSWTGLGVNSTTLDSDATNETYWYRFEVTPQDGKGTGNPANSSEKQIIAHTNSTTYSGVYNEKMNLTIANGASITISGSLDCDGNVTVLNGGTLDFGSNNQEIGSLTVAGTCTGSSGTMYITGENSSSGYAVDLDGTFTNNSGTVQINTTSATEVDLIASAGGVYDLIINAGSTVGWDGNTFLGDDLAVTSGTFQPKVSGDAINVVDNVTVNGGTLGGNSPGATWDFGSLYLSSGTVYSTDTKIVIRKESNNYAVNLDGGTFTNNSGSLCINTDSATLVDLMPSSGGVYFLDIMAGSTVDWEGNTNLGYRLKVSSGTFRPKSASDTINVITNVTVQGGTLGGNSASGDWTFGTLYQWLGTIDATTGTIYITNEGNNYAIRLLDGTYTANSATIEVNTEADTLIDIDQTGGNLYKLIIDTMGYTVTNKYAATVDDNITIEAGEFDLDADLTVKNMQIDSGAEFDIKGDNTFIMNNDGTLVQNGDFHITSGDAISVSLAGTKFNLTNGNNVALHQTPTTPSDPANYANIGKYVNLSAIGASPSVDINTSYTHSDLGTIVESTLVMFEYNETTETWTQSTGITGLDMATNNVWNNSATAFSIYAPMGEEWTNSLPTATGEQPENATTGHPLQMAVGCTINDADANHTMNVTFATNTTGSWVNYQTNSSISNGGTVNWTFTQASSNAVFYWWRVYVHDGDYNETYTFYYETINNKPTVTGEYPTNHTDDPEITYPLQIAVGATVNDADTNHVINATFATNESGSWVNKQTNATVVSGTGINWTFTEANTASTTYWWRIYVNDGYSNQSFTYNFTTNDNTAPSATGEQPSNGSTGEPLQRAVGCTVTDPDAGVTLTATFATNTTGTWVNYQTNGSLSNGDKINWTFTQASSNAVTYWWRVYVDDGAENETFTFHYETKNTDPTVTGEQPSNQSTDQLLQIAVGCTVNDADTGHTINATFATNESGSWVNKQTNTSLASGTGINWTFAQSNSNAVTYWWRIYINDGYTNKTYTFYYETTNNKPTVTGEHPTNHTDDPETTYPLQIAVGATVNDADTNHVINATFATNESGSWVNKQTNTTVVSGTGINWTFTEANTASTTYWWRIYVNDGYSNQSFTYNFTTQAINTSVDTISPYNQTSSTLTINATGDSSLDNVTLWYRWSVDNSSWGSWMENTTDAASPWQWAFNFTNANDTGYYEFYSIGKKSGSTDESAPASNDTFCYYEPENISINVTPSSWNVGDVTIGSNNYSTINDNFILVNEGNVVVNIQIKGDNATNATTGAEWTLVTTSSGPDNFMMKYNRSSDSSWTNIDISYASFYSDLAIDGGVSFDLNLFVATTSTKDDPLSLNITFKAVAS